MNRLWESERSLKSFFLNKTTTSLGTNISLLFSGTLLLCIFRIVDLGFTSSSFITRDVFLGTIYNRLLEHLLDGGFYTLNIQL